MSIIAAAISAALAFTTPMGIGHNGGPAHITAHRGHYLAVSLPPHSFVETESACHWFGDDPEVQTQRTGSYPREHWSDAHTVEHFGPVSFNGVRFQNTSGQWFNVYALIVEGC